MTQESSKADRYARLEKVLNALVALERFTAEELKAILPQETPAFVTRVVYDLEREGHLRRDDRDNFSWATPVQLFPVKVWLEGRIYGAQLPQTSAEDRPRERLLAHGAAALRTPELLAILIRSGRTGESALQAGEKIAARYRDRLDRLPAAGRGDLKGISAAVGETAFCQIMAGIELGRRVAEAIRDKEQPTRRIQSSDDALAFCRDHFARLVTDQAKEEFHIVCLDAKHRFLGAHSISVGSLDRSLVHPREVFRPAIQDAAKTILLVHNHPSGDPTPGEDDLAVTQRLEEAGQTLGIQVLDHIIVARNGATSIAEYRTGLK